MERIRALKRFRIGVVMTCLQLAFTGGITRNRATVSAFRGNSPRIFPHNHKIKRSIIPLMTLYPANNSAFVVRILVMVETITLEIFLI